MADTTYSPALGSARPAPARNFEDRLFRLVATGFAIFVLVILGGVVVALVQGALPALGGNTVDLIDDYQASIDAMTHEIDGAIRFVHVEYYIVSFDATTRGFFGALERAVQRGVPRSDIQVRDIMTSREALEVLDMREVNAATVGHIVATLKAAGRQHTLVVERDVQGRQRVRGVFSATQIARQLGIAFTTETVARTFADIEANLGH